jgi:hypothetical protein
MADPRTRAEPLPGMDGPQVQTTQPTPIAAPQMQVSDQPFQADHVVGAGVPNLLPKRLAPKVISNYFLYT